MEPQTQVTFGDVAGIDQAKLELNEVVDLRRTAFTAVGAKFPEVCCWWGHRELVKHCWLVP